MDDSPLKVIRAPATCPMCGEVGRCKNHAQYGDDAVMCFHTFDAPNGYKRSNASDQCAVFVRKGSDADRLNGFNPAHQNRKIETKPGRYFDADAERLSRQITADQIEALTAELGVTADSLRRIHIGHDGEWPCFPERDLGGRVLGINRRRGPGFTPKYMVRKGDRRGLIVPDNFAELSDPVVIVEGPTDVAALIDMGVPAVGRPNNLGGSEHLAEVLKGREVLIVGENDCDEKGNWPGKKGAQSIAKKLSTAWGRPVRWALLPEGIKDAREYRNQHASEDPREVGKRLLDYLRRTPR